MLASKIKLMKWKIVVAAAVVSGTCFLVMPGARADIIKLEGGSTCNNLTQAVSECNGSTAWQLTSLLSVLSTPNILDSLGEGTDVFLVTDNVVGGSFSFTLGSTGQNNTGVASNGKCDFGGGGITSLFSQCMIKDANGQTTTYGATQINNLTFPATISFTGPAGFGQTFYLEFISMQGTSNVVSAPEPSSLALLAAGLFGLAGFARRKLTS
jgi:hypothetical protein